MPSPVLEARARLAATVRHHPDLDVTELRRDLKAAGLEQHIRETVDAAPPLTVEQRVQLAAVLLRGGVTP